MQFPPVAGIPIEDRLYGVSELRLSSEESSFQGNDFGLVFHGKPPFVTAQFPIRVSSERLQSSHSRGPCACVAAIDTTITTCAALRSSALMVSPFCVQSDRNIPHP